MSIDCSFPAADELEETMSMTNKLAALRKDKGDRWLAILNAKREPGADDDQVGREEKGSS